MPNNENDTTPSKSVQTNAFSYGNTALLGLSSLNYRHTLSTSDVVQLCKHDYYTGWLDAHRALDHQKSLVLEAQAKKMDTCDPILGAQTDYLRDRSNPHNPFNAGMNAGLTFAYSALCRTHNLQHLDTRLDIRRWELSALKPARRLLGRSRVLGRC